jgi:chorismate synthase
MAWTMQGRLAYAGRAAHRHTSRKLAVCVRAAGSTYGTNFRVTTFGESHGKGVGCVIDGVPPRLPITEDEIQLELDRRKPGQSIITTPRKEDDIAEILSGVVDGVTLGTPIAIVVRNKDQKSQDYTEMAVAYRPSHADATYDFKYGIRAVAGGGRSSARETIGRVAAGAVAKKLLKVIGDTEVGADPHLRSRSCTPHAAFTAGHRYLTLDPVSRGRAPVPRCPCSLPRVLVCALVSGQVLAFVSKVRDIDCSVDLARFTLEDVESNIVRCPDQAAAQRMIDGASRKTYAHKHTPQ